MPLPSISTSNLFSVIMRNKPVLQRVVKTKANADVFTEAMSKKSNILCEVFGHVVTNGRYVKRINRVM
jgi:hypothetical protein